MKHRFFLSALVASLPAAYAQAAPVRVMVHALVSEGDPSFGEDLTERLAAQLSNLGREKIRVLIDSEVALMLRRIKDEIDLNLENCRKSEVCLAKLAAESESDYAFKGRVELLGGSFVGVLSRVDLKKGTPPLSESYAAATKEELTQAMFRIGARMLGLDDQGPVRPKLEQPISSANKKVALVPLAGIKEEPAIAGYLSESLAVELLKMEFSVMTNAEQILLLRNAAERHKLTKPGEPMDDVIAEVASGMGADYLIAGIIEKIERGHFVIVLKLIDVQQASVINRASESYRGPVAHLPLSLKFCLSELLGREISGEGAISIVTDVEGRFQIDQKAAVALPQQEPIAGLIAAKYDLQISVEGYKNYFANFYVDGGVEGMGTGSSTGASFLKFRPELEVEEPEFYETWWFWSIVGVAAAGGTAAVLLATVPPKDGPLAFEY